MSAQSMLTSSLFVLWLALSPQTTPPPTQTAPPPKPQTPPSQQTTPPPKPQTPPPTSTQPPAKPPAKPPSASSASSSKPAAVELSVTTMVGMTIPGATVKAEGPTSRAGTTGADGRIVFENLPAGTYRFRIERDSFVTLEKEVLVWSGVRTAAQAVLSAGAATPAPAAPPPPAPAPTMSGPVLKAGEPRMLSLTDNIAEQLLREKDPVAERQLGCSGATSSRLIRVNDSLTVHSHADADEVLYIVAGDVTLKLGEKEQTLTPGWFSLVPRGMAHSLTRRGRNPVLILSTVSGPPCQ
jgi:mannose-6-phosphate isomerase-like protein (cupin superfamily)